MKRFDVGVTPEIVNVEGQDVLDPVHSHGGGESRIMNLSAGNIV